MKIGELFFNLGFHADTMKLKDFSRAVSELSMASILSAGTFGAMVEGAKALISIADDMALGINKFGRETGQSTQDIQKWTKVAEQMGVSADTVTSSVATLEDNLFKMKFTGEGSNIWNMLGLDPTHTQDMFQVLSMLRERLKGMSTEQQRFFLQNLGLSTEMLNMFKLSDEQWKNIVTQQTMSDEQLKKMVDFHRENKQLGQDIKLLWVDIASTIVPIVTDVVSMARHFTDFLRDSKEWREVIDDVAKILAMSAKGWKLIGQGAKMLAGSPTVQGGTLPNAMMFDPRSAFGVLNAAGAQQNPKGNTTIHAPITINGNDPHAIGVVVQKHLDKQHSDAVNERPEGSI